MDKEFEDLLNNIKTGSKPPLNVPNLTLQPTISAQSVTQLTSDKLEDFLLKNASNIVQNGVELIKDLKDSITQAIDADEVSALADMIKATNGSLEILNKLNINNKKLNIKSGGKIINSGNTNIFVGTREDVLSQLNINKNKSKKETIVNAEFTEIDEDEDVSTEPKVPSLIASKNPEEIIDIPKTKEPTLIKN